MKPKFLKHFKHIHILGIAGTMTAPLAMELTRQGITVTGSDQEKIYPPVSTILNTAGIKLNSTPITRSIDLVIVGGSYAKFKRTTAEFEEVKKLGIPYESASVFLGKLINSPNQIIVAGTFGKTTISGALSWGLTQLQTHPSYYFGGFTPHNFPPLSVDTSDYSVIEGGEDINGLDTGPKFDYYPLNHLVLTSADWEHKESYATPALNTSAFSRLIRRLTPGSIFVYNPNSQSATNLSHQSPVTPVPYDFSLQPLIKTDLIGQANLENLIASATMLISLGFPQTQVLKSLSTFKGIKRRLEIVYQSSQLVVVDDFAQSAPRVLATLRAIKSRYPQFRLVTFFEAHATSLMYRQSLPDLASSLQLSDQIILGPLPYSAAISKQDRTTPLDYHHLLGPKLTYLPDTTQITSHLLKLLTPHTVLVHLSSGGQTGLNILEAIVNSLPSAKI